MVQIVKELAILEWADVPPSLNRQGRVHPMKQARLKRQLEDVLFVLLLEAKVPRGLASVEARAKLRFPVRRRRDEGNFRWLLEKALGDVLQAGGWLEDDTPDQYRFFGLEFEDELGPRRTTVVLTF